MTDSFDFLFDSLGESLSINSENYRDIVNKQARIAYKDLKIKTLEVSSISLSEDFRKHKSQKSNLEKQIQNVSAFYEVSAHEASALRENIMIKLVSHKSMLMQRLRSQQSTSERRLEELALEMIGEYSKGILRARRREQTLYRQDQNSLILETWTLLLRKFLLRLQFDLKQAGNPKAANYLKLLDAEKDSAEILRILGKVNKRIGLFTEERMLFHSVVRINKPPMRVVEESAQVFSFAHTADELEHILEQIRSFLNTSSSRNQTRSPHQKSNQSKPAIKMQDFISCLGVQFLQGPSLQDKVWQNVMELTTDHHKANGEDADKSDFSFLFSVAQGSFFVSDSVYFCLEERSLLQLLSLLPLRKEGTEDTSELLQTLQELYADSPRLQGCGFLSSHDAVQSLELLREMYGHHPFSFSSDGIHFSHRTDAVKHSLSKRQSSALAQTLKTFPDILAAKSLLDPKITLHFAPACLLNLIEYQHLNNTDAAGKVLNLRTGSLGTLFYQVGSKLVGTGTLNNRDRNDSALIHQLESSIGNCRDSMNQKESRGRIIQNNHPSSSNYVNLILPITTEVEMCTLLEHYQVKPKPSLEESHKVHWSCLNILPDYLARQTLLPKSSKKRLSYRYLLMEHTSKSTSTIQGSQPEERLNCLYLFQLFPQNHNGESYEAHKHLNQVLLEQYKSFFKEEPIVTSIASSNNQSDVNSSNGYLKADLKSHWDSAVISSFCQWRSCLSPVRSHRDALCRYHSNLQVFLDEKLSNSKGAESSKYLPKKPPQFTADIPLFKRDLMTIRAASTLLQELWDGRLKQTLKLFNRKIAQDVKIRSFLESKLGAKYILKWMEDLMKMGGVTEIVLPPPSWILWRNKELLQRMIVRQDGSLQLLQGILAYEKQIGQEIEDLSDLQVFPSQEIAVIRKDLKVLRDRQQSSIEANNISNVEANNGDSKGGLSKKGKSVQQQSTSSLSMDLLSDNYDNLIDLLQEELNVCNKKLQLLRSRTEQETEVRTLLNKRASRLKAMEESQARDPAHFKNQSKF